MRDTAVEGTLEMMRHQGRRTMTIVMRHVDHAAFVVIIAGWWDILVAVVLEGILLQMVIGSI